MSYSLRSPASSLNVRRGGVRFPLRKALGTGSSQLKRAGTSALFESSGLARQMCTGSVARTVKSEPVMRFESVRKDGDPPPGLQGSLTRSRSVLCRTSCFGFQISEFKFVSYFVIRASHLPHITSPPSLVSRVPSATPACAGRGPFACDSAGTSCSRNWRRSFVDRRRSAALACIPAPVP